MSAGLALTVRVLRGWSTMPRRLSTCLASPTRTIGTSMATRASGSTRRKSMCRTLRFTGWRCRSLTMARSFWPSTSRVMRALVPASVLSARRRSGQGTDDGHGVAAEAVDDARHLAVGPEARGRAGAGDAAGFGGEGQVHGGCSCGRRRGRGRAWRGRSCKRLAILPAGPLPCEPAPGVGPRPPPPRTFGPAPGRVPEGTLPGSSPDPGSHQMSSSATTTAATATDTPVVPAVHDPAPDPSIMVDEPADVDPTARPSSSAPWSGSCCSSPPCG